MDQNSKRMTPEEIAKFYDCNGKDGPKCPILGWCMNCLLYTSRCV